jgi:hypothetical protein
MSIPNYDSHTTYVASVPDTLKPPVSADQIGYVGNRMNSNSANLKSMAKLNAVSSMVSNATASISNSMAAFTGNKAPPNTTPPADNNDFKQAPTSEDGLLATLYKLFLAILSIPRKFGLAFGSIFNASIGISLGMEGILRLFAVFVLMISKLLKLSVDIVIKYIGVFIDILFKLPRCFLVHCVKIVCAILYNIFPATSYIFAYFTGITLMPYFEKAFYDLDQADNWISENIIPSSLGNIYLLKFPKEITDYCYTCNGKPLRLNDILTDVYKIGTITDESQNMMKSAGSSAKPAAPFLLRAKRLFDRLNRK